VSEKIRRVHFIGINGSGMSGVACIAKRLGFGVTGCDANGSGDYTQQLLKNGINILVGHSPEHLKDVDAVVLTPALLYKDKYKSVEEAKVAMETKLCMKWQKFLGEYITGRKNVVVATGTHGKTTTTTLIALMLERGFFDPTVFVGGVVKEWDWQSYRVGESDFYVLEGDEYDGNFLNYYPRYAILNNLEMEHPERFSSFEEYKDIFRQFLHNIQEHGVIVFYYDDENLLELITSMKHEFDEKHIRLVAYTLNANLKNVCPGIKIYVGKVEQNRCTIGGKEFRHKLMGVHNAKNIIITTLMAMEIGVKEEYIREVLANFSGTKRRLDLVFSNDRIKIYDDYAHHHTQVKCVIDTLRDNFHDKNEKLIAILEPHLISRIKNNTEEYKNALLSADYPIITKIYKSREEFMDDIDVKALINDDKIPYIENFDDVIATVSTIINTHPNDKYTIAVMGAGNSYKLATQLETLFSNGR